MKQQASQCPLNLYAINVGAHTPRKNLYMPKVSTEAVPSKSKARKCTKQKPRGTQYHGSHWLYEGLPKHCGSEKCEYRKELPQKYVALHSNDHNITFWKWWTIGLVYIVQNCHIETFLLSNVSHLLYQCIITSLLPSKNP